LPEKVYSPEEPDDSVVKFIDALLERNAKTILDLACGAGRHVAYMAKQGLDTNGADISDIGLKLTLERLRKQELKAALVKCDMKHLPYRDFSIDAVICMRAIYHQELKEIQETILEIRRVLKKSGSVLVDFLSKRTYSYGKGAETEKDTFIETEGHEKDVLHHFTDEPEIEHLFRDFEIIKVTLREREVDGKLRSRWTVQAMA
jgi:ubiquinone/menaquinone biosynthesis C-methylase UbiE